MSNKEQLLREFIAMILLEDIDEDLLVEPDVVDDGLDDQRRDEFAVAGGVPGVITPLGTGPTYPGSSVKKKKRRKRTK